jgi:sulfite reductase alpha subunit-like flavoprotein
MPRQVEDACVEAISKGSKDKTTAEEAQEMVTEWKINGRYNVEVW